MKTVEGLVATLGEKMTYLSEKKHSKNLDFTVSRKLIVILTELHKQEYVMTRTKIKTYRGE